MPISRRTFSNGTSIPCSASASTQARACASLLSTSVPSTSRRTPRYRPIPLPSLPGPRSRAAHARVSGLLHHLAGLDQLFDLPHLVADEGHVVPLEALALV